MVSQEQSQLAVLFGSFERAERPEFRLLDNHQWAHYQDSHTLADCPNKTRLSVSSFLHSVLFENQINRPEGEQEHVCMPQFLPVPPSGDAHAGQAVYDRSERSSCDL